MAFHMGFLNGTKSVGALLHRTRTGGWIARIATSFLMGYWNRSNFDIQSNGESCVVECLARSTIGSDPVVVFDVGANVGDWSRVASSRLGHARIFAFELDPHTAEDCRRNCKPIENHETVACGLSDNIGTADFYSLGDGACGSSIERLNSNLAVVRKTHLITGDVFCSERGISRIDLLKIDVEGHERAVIRGFNEMIKRHAVPVVQFEYGITSLSAGVMLRDLYEELSSLGYSIGRLYPDGVEIKAYDHVEDESHIMGNYLALLNNDVLGRFFIDQLSLKKFGRNSI